MSEALIPSFPENVKLLSARAFVLNDQNRLLFVRRTLSSKTNPGLWEPIGGLFEPEIDSSLWITRTREAEEEVCLDIEPLDSEWEFEVTLPYVGGDQDDLKIIRYGISRVISQTDPIMGPELSGYSWKDLDHVYDMEYTPETIPALRAAVPRILQLIDN